MNWSNVNWEAVAALGEIAGALGVVASLFYLGIQTRADTRARRMATIQQELRAQSSFQAALGMDADASDIYSRGLRNPAGLSETESVQFSLIADSVFRGCEASFYYAQEGELGEEQWPGLSSTLDSLLAYPGMRSVWRVRKNQHGPKFQSFVEAKLAKSGAPALYEPPPSNAPDTAIEQGNVAPSNSSMQRTEEA